MGLRNRSKYSDSFREGAIWAVLNDHRSRRDVARELGIDHKVIRCWVAQSTSVAHCIGNEGYDGSFKLQVVRCREEKGLSLLSTATLFGIGSERTILEWERIYASRGAAGLYEHKPRGRPPQFMGRPKKKEPQTELEKLQAENAYLKAEVAFLKKVRALVEERIARESGRRPRRFKD